MSDDRADETEDREERPAEKPAAPQPASAAARRGRAAGRAARPAARVGGDGKGGPTSPRGGTATKASLRARVMKFLREVVAELRKVIWPTRKQQVTYTLVVLVFVSFMVALVALLDFGFGKVMFFVFG